MMFTRRFSLIFLVTFLVSVFMVCLAPLVAHADFTASNLMDDAVFENYGSMDAAGINAFLNLFPNSCISPNSGFESRISTGYTPSGGFTYGDFVSAGQVIYAAAQVYGINPQVLMVTLQKEQSLVIGAANYCNNGDEHKYAAAVGYGCPDSGGYYNWSGVSLYRRSGIERTVTGQTCVNSAAKAGFSQQVIRAAWLLRFGQQRSFGNVGWAVIKPGWDNSDDPASCYGGPMTQGNRKRCSSDSSAIFYDGFIPIDGVSTHMDTGATAALYWYTPHFHGNQNFVSIFESWFGSVRSGQCSTAAIPPAVAGVTFRKYAPRIEQANLIIYQGSSTNCIESHTWNIGVTSWASHVATNTPIVSPANAQVLYGDINGDGIDEPILVSLSPTGSGKIEFHIWNRDQNKWSSHIVTDASADALTNGRIVFADVDGTGKDVPVVILMSGTASGKVEFHVFNHDLKSMMWHVASNLNTINTADGTVTFADVDGNGVDEPVLIGYRNQGSGMVEFHTWGPDWRSWRYHTASNQPSINPNDSFITFADVDGSRIDKAVLVGTKNTGSGKIEFHTWQVGVTSWRYHTASNQPTF